jgi:lysophospholipase L1-like esterase
MKNTFVVSVLFNLILAFLLISALIHHFRKEEDPLTKISRFEPQKLAAKRIERILRQSPQHISVVMLGNSITEYGGDWNARLGRDDIRNSGQGGYTTGQLCWLLDSCVIKAKPKYCFIMAGINDLSLGIPVNKVFANYKIMIDTLLAGNIHPVVQSTLRQRGNPAGNVRVDYLNHLLEAYCNEKNILFIDLNRTMTDQDGLMENLTTDGTHLSGTGYEVWTEKLKWTIAKLNF